MLDELGLDVEVYYSSEINPDAKLVATYHHCPTHLGDAVQLNRAQVGIYVLHTAVKGGVHPIWNLHRVPQTESY